MPLSPSEEASALEDRWRKLDPVSGEDYIYELREDVVSESGFWQERSDDEHDYFWYPPNYEEGDYVWEDAWEVIACHSDLTERYIVLIRTMINDLENKS